MELVHLSRLMMEGRPSDHVVAIRNGKLLTWRTFAGSVAALQRDISASSSRRWVLACRDAFEFLAALFAVWHAGRTAIIPVNFQKENLADPAIAADGMVTGPQLISDDCSPEWKSLDPRSTRLILYTSGSTGVPKSIEKTLFQLDAEVSALEEQWGESLNDSRMVATVPHYHIYGLLFRLLWPIASGRAFVVEELTMPDEIQSAIIKHAPVAIVSSPSHLDRIPDLLDLSHAAPHVSRIFSSGSPLSPRTAAEYKKKLGTAPTEVLGSTETGGIAWRSGMEEWTPFRDASVRLAQHDALEVRSPRTAGQDWHITGDRAEFRDDGSFRLTGRLDRVAKIEGKRISLDDIEKKLNAHEWIARSGVTALEGGRKTVGAAVVLSRSGQSCLAGSGRRALLAGLKVYLSQWFEPVVIPRQWRVVRALPVDDRGKTTAASLASLFRQK